MGRCLSDPIPPIRDWQERGAVLVPTAGRTALAPCSVPGYGEGRWHSAAQAKLPESCHPAQQPALPRHSSRLTQRLLQQEMSPPPPTNLTSRAGEEGGFFRMPLIEGGAAKDCEIQGVLQTQENYTAIQVRLGERRPSL